MVLESNIQRASRLTILRTWGVQSLALKKLSSTGYPDVIFLIPGGYPLFVEFKQPGHFVSPIQEYRIAALKALGYDVVICTTVQQCREHIQKRLGAPSVST